MWSIGQGTKTTAASLQAKADGVVHKKTRDGRYIRPDGFISYYPPLC
jgi:hypothetical protein